MTTPEQKQYHTCLDEVVSNAKESLVRDGEHQPTLIVEGSLGLVSGKLPGMPESHSDKLIYMRLLGRQAAESGRIGRLRQIFFVSGGSLWEENEAIYLDFSPSQNLMQQEVLFISGVDLLEHRKHLALLEVRRDSNGQVAGFSDLILNLHQPIPLETPLEDAFVSGFKVAS